MRVPISWLREYVAVDASAEEIAERLTISTCEVKDILRTGVADTDGNLGLFRVGKVVEAGKHPNADRLQLCRVDVGEGEPRQIVCGAWNFGAGATVAVGLPGAVLPGGLKLERRKLRGELSDGMILSERELELGPDHTGIMVLPDELEAGAPLADALPLGETVLEVETTGNRPDLLAVYGIAREVAALFAGAELAPPPGHATRLRMTGDEPVGVRVDDLEGCPRYIGRLFRDVSVGPSPPWLRARLVAAGIRPHSNVVDVTNYVMHALGNPLHAFDLARLGEGRVIVRRARPGERIRTLDDVDRALDPRDLVIADAERPVAIAGIMGGKESEVDETTTDLLLEAANFEPVSILQTSERLKLRTDGSNRWEKGVDPYLAPQAARLATELIVDLTGARWTGESEVSGQLPERPVVRFRPERADAVIGVETPPERQRAELQALGFEVGEDWVVTVPTWRARDVTREIDLVEEVARLELDRVPFTLPPRRELFGRLTREQRLRRLVEDVLVGLGFHETYNPSLAPADPDPHAWVLPDPITSEQAVLRTTLLLGLVESARRNVDAGNDGIALFEIARGYLPRGGPLPEERWHAGGLAEGGSEQAKGAVEALYRTLKIEPRFERGEGPFLHPGKVARLDEGWVGELHPDVLGGRWGAFELDLDLLAQRWVERVHYEDVITFPAVKQDLAFVVPENVQAGDLVAAAREAVGPELREIRPFDVYRGEQVGPGRKSIAFSVVFQSRERTLSDEDAGLLRQRLVAALERRFGAVLRA
jgi:phenylalanyl-tRNA synthetase beta chain